MTGGDLPVHVRATAFTVSCLPEDENSHDWDILVEYAGRGLWAVRRGVMCLDKSGKWDYEPTSSSRTDEWYARNRFGQAEAEALAVAAAPKVKVMGNTPEGYLRWKKENEHGLDAV